MYLQPHYGNGVFANVYLLAGHCRHPIAVMGVVDTFGHEVIFFASCTFFFAVFTMLVLSWRSIKTFLQLSTHVLKLYDMFFLIFNKFQNQTFLQQVPHVGTSIAYFYTYMYVSLFYYFCYILVIKSLNKHMSHNAS